MLTGFEGALPRLIKDQTPRDIFRERMPHV